MFAHVFDSRFDVPLKNKPFSKDELATSEAPSDFAGKSLQSVQEMKAGHVQVVTSPGLAKRSDSPNPSLRRFWGCPCVPCSDRSKVANNLAVPRALCSPSPQQIRKRCWL